MECWRFYTSGANGKITGRRFAGCGGRDAALDSPVEMAAERYPMEEVESGDAILPAPGLCSAYSANRDEQQFERATNSITRPNNRLSFGRDALLSRALRLRALRAGRHQACPTNAKIASGSAVQKIRWKPGLVLRG